MIIEQSCYERGCACYDDRVDTGIVMYRRSNLVLLLVGMLSLTCSILTFTVIFFLSTALRVEEPYGFLLALLWSLAPMILGMWEPEVSRFLYVNKETT
jgi:hypothetical protein